jgi:hypothetical protein
MGQLFRGSAVDLTISINREKLIGILTDNRQKHESHFTSAVEGYKKKLIEHAQKNLARAEKGKHPESFPRSKPVSYIPQYDRALGMLKMSDEDSVSLSAPDYVRFVEDDWDWKDTFADSSSFYSPEIADDFLIGAAKGP